MENMTDEKRSGCDLIKAERERQITTEGWSAEHDARHQSGELARAAACYAVGEKIKWMRGYMTGVGFEHEPRIVRMWPWEDQWWKPVAGDRVRELVKAGALIAAEIDRLIQNGGEHPSEVGEQPMLPAPSCSDAPEKEPEHGHAPVIGRADGSRKRERGAEADQAASRSPNGAEGRPQASEASVWAASG